MKLHNPECLGLVFPQQEVAEEIMIRNLSMARLLSLWCPGISGLHLHVLYLAPGFVGTDKIPSCCHTWHYFNLGDDIFYCVSAALSDVDWCWVRFLHINHPALKCDVDVNPLRLKL